MNVGGLTLEPRMDSSRRWQILAFLLALTAAFGLGAALIATAGANIPDAIAAFWRGAFGDAYSIKETLVQATPLIFTGLAMVVAFRAKVWNIGAEGQFFAGALATIGVTLAFPHLPGPVMVAAILAGAAIGGAIWGMIPGILKAQFGANEVVVTVMLNYVMQYLLSYIVGGVWRDPSSFYIQTAQIPQSAHLPRILPPGRLHLGFLVAIGAAGLIYVLLWRTVLGYEIRAVGSNPQASRYRGISVGWVIVLVMVISGALAGLAGGSEVAGLHHRLRLDISTGYGFTGIIVALLARLNPIGTVFAAILFGALVNGSTSMQISTGVPVALVYAVQGLTLIFILVADVLGRYRIRRTVRPQTRLPLDMKEEARV
jgi:general nucleoside transport system permease protein